MATKTLLTAAEFFGSGPETDGCELVRGEVVRMPPPGSRHGEVVANVIFLLKAYVKGRGTGAVLGAAAGMLTERDPDTVRGADAAVYLRPTWHGARAPVGYAVEPADLLVEVRSPSDRWPQVLRKATEYLTMGVRLVWVVDPARERVTVFTQDEEPRTFAPENDLDGGDVLPGLRCRVAELFE